MSIHYTDKSVTLHHGNCLDILAELPDASVDAVVTDPPYGLSNTTPQQVADTLVRWVNGDRDYIPAGAGFMGRAWDAFVPPVAVWDECLRVLKPGGHVLAFAGSRTHDLMTLALRLAGFDIRDSVAWLYGSGFPKSLDVSKAIDKAAGAEREVTGRTLTPFRVDAAADRGTSLQGSVNGNLSRQTEGGYRYTEHTAPATPDAERWQGWGTALKPAFEPVVVARKPLAGTVAANVLAHGTGALNIDGCRIEGQVPQVTQGLSADPSSWEPRSERRLSNPHAAGRWPANVVLDESQAAALDQQSGEGQSRIGKPRGADHGDGWGMTATGTEYDDQGGASRFFYTAKAAADERPFFFRPACECEDAWPTHTPSAARATDATTAQASSNTSKSGSDTTGSESPRATRSTTSTGTSSTTIPTTSSPSLRPTTSASTPAASSATGSGGSPAGSAASSNPSELPTGISAAKDGRSTDAAGPVTSRAWSRTSVCGRCGAPSRREAHATVKPLSLMRWLVRLVTPPGGTILEPFAGSGTTVEAAILEGFHCVAIEREDDYLPLITQRIHRRRNPVEAVKNSGEDGGLFDLLLGEDVS